MDFAFMRDTFFRLLEGVPLTLNLTFTSIALGAVFAMLFALMRMSGVTVLDWIARAYVFVFRGTPLLVQIFLIYYGLGQFRPALQELNLWGFFREPYWCAILALTLNTHLLLLLICGINVMEAGSVAIQMGVFKASGRKRRLFRMSPIHHHFELAGWPETTVIIRFWLLSAVSVASALAIFIGDFTRVTGGLNG